jgi:hypothetical protein
MRKLILVKSAWLTFCMTPDKESATVPKLATAKNSHHRSKILYFSNNAMITTSLKSYSTQSSKI